MHCTMKALVLATLAAGQAFAASIGNTHSVFHNHNHARKHDHAEKRNVAITAADQGKLAALGVFAAGGINSYAPTAGAWIGADGAYKSEFSNQSGEDLILVVWGVAGSWVNAVQPHITVSIAAGQSIWVSFADGASGAFTGVYADTKLVNGQLSNTWGEFTFGHYGVYDVSREVKMDGHGLSIASPTCLSDMNTCVFKCSSGNVCTYGYVLENCANGSQPGANYGVHEGAPSGGCSVGTTGSASIKATFT